MAIAPLRTPITWARNACDLELVDLIEEARDAFAGELAIPMTVAQPPEIREKDASGNWTTDARLGAQVGLSMSAPLYRRLHHPEGYGNTFPMARALDDLRGWCRGRHVTGRRGTWDDHLATAAWERPLCARIAWAVVVWRTTPAWAARQERLPVIRTARLLEDALQHAWEQRREWAHASDSGVAEVMADQRRERREARLAVVDPAPTACRYCGSPYDASSEMACPGGDDRMTAEERAAFAATYPGVTLLCAPLPAGR